ncbi:MAG: hypothetical protein GY867_06180 [bacterium]|nr:hypothetical protein [bacterium]
MKNRVTLKNRTSKDHSEQADLVGGVSLFELANVLLNRRRFIAWTVGCVLLLAAVILILTPNQYTSSASILPTGSTDRLAGLKSLAGLGNLVSVDENSSDMFPVILRSRQLKQRLLDASYTYAYKDETVTTTLTEYLDQGDPDKLLDALGSITRISTDKKTGVTHVSVETDFPGLSQRVLQRYLAELEDFNLNHRRSKGKDNSEYLERELVERKGELAKAENKLESFQLANQDWQMTGSPEVLKELTRLRRHVQIKTSVCLLMEKEYEMARLDAQKDVPVVSVLDAPSQPSVKSGPYRATTLAVTAMATLFISLLLVIMHAGITGALSGSRREDYEGFREDLAEMFPKTSRVVSRAKKQEAVGV